MSMFTYNIFYTVGQKEYVIENYRQDAELSFLAEQPVLFRIHDDMKARGLEGKVTQLRATDTNGNGITDFDFKY